MPVVWQDVPSYEASQPQTSPNRMEPELCPCKLAWPKGESLQRKILDPLIFGQNGLKWHEMMFGFHFSQCNLTIGHSLHTSKNVPKHKNHKLGTFWRELQDRIVPANVLLSGEATSTFVALALHAPGVELKAAVKPLWFRKVQWVDHW